MGYSTVQKIEAEGCFNEHDLPVAVTKAAGDGKVNRADLADYLQQRAIDKKKPGESVQQSYARNFVGGAAGPDDPVGAKLHQTLRKLETAYAGRPDDDPTGAELFKRMIAA